MLFGRGRSLARAAHRHGGLVTPPTSSLPCDRCCIAAAEFHVLRPFGWAQAGGKGTITKTLSQWFGLPTLSIGDLLRTTNDAAVLEMVRAGKLLEDSRVLDIARAWIQRMAQTHTTLPGLLYDGLPRTLSQAQGLQAQFPRAVAPSIMFELNLPPRDLVFRVALRRVHLASGRTYHLCHRLPQHARYATLSDPPNTVSEGQVVWLDDDTHEPLVQRADDTPQVFRERLKVYTDQTRAVLEYYRHQGMYWPVAGHSSATSILSILNTLHRLGYLQAAEPVAARAASQFGATALDS